MGVKCCFKHRTTIHDKRQAPRKDLPLIVYLNMYQSDYFANFTSRMKSVPTPNEPALTLCFQGNTNMFSEAR